MEFFSSTTFGILFVLFVIAVVYVISVRVKNQRETREALDNPRSHNVNETNYNIDREGVDGHRLPDDGMDTLRQVESLDDTEQIPTDEEFYEGREKIS